jgi:hypothetical protein
MRNRAFVVFAVVMFALAAPSLAGCARGGAQAQGPTSTGVLESTLVTDISRPVDISWHPADSPTASDLAVMTDGLRTQGLAFLRPSAPTFAGAASTSASFIILETVPTHFITLEMVVYEGDDPDPLIAVEAQPGAEPAGAHGTQAVTVRGQKGYGQVTEGGISMLDWVEAGLEWLDAWIPVVP